MTARTVINGTLQAAWASLPACRPGFAGGSIRGFYVPDSTAFQLTSSLTIGAWVNVQANGYASSSAETTGQDGTLTRWAWTVRTHGIPNTDATAQPLRFYLPPPVQRMDR